MNVVRRLVPVATLLAACAHGMIPGTAVRDTDENREVLAVIQELERAVQERDVGGVITLVSARYFEDMGTPAADDDYGFEQLKDEVLPRSMAVTKEIYLSFEVHEIVVEGDLAHADVRYKSRARLDLPSGTLWDSHREFNRIELAREEGAWRITAGL